MMQISFTLTFFQLWLSTGCKTMTVLENVRAGWRHTDFNILLKPQIDNVGAKTT